MQKLLPYLLLFISFTLHASNDFVIDNYDIIVNIDADGLCHVTETIEVNYNKKMRGIYRDLELKGTFKNHLQVLSITDVKVDGYKYKVEKKGSQLRVRIGDKDIYIDGKHTYVIQYTAFNGILNFANHEEFYWTLVPANWKEVIREARFEINLPKEVEFGPDDVKIFIGEEGESSGYGKVFIDNNKKIIGESLIPLGRGKSMTASFKVPKGYFFNSDKPLSKESSSTKPISAKKSKDLSYPLPIMLFLGLIVSFYKWGKNKDSYEHVEIFYPPENMTPATVGTFHDYKVNNRDVISLIPYWGQQGLLKIRAADSSKHPKLFIEKYNEIPDNRPNYEKYFFTKLFEQRDHVSVDDLKYRFYNKYSIIKSLIYKEALNPPLYDNEAKKIFHSTPMIMLGIASVFAGMASIFHFGMLKTGVGFFLFALTCFIIKSMEPKKSAKGIHLHNELESFKDTLMNTDDERLIPILEKDPDYFDKIYPYAVAFGIDKQWTDKFKGMFDKAPDWYYGNSAILFTDFQRDFRVKDVGSKMSVPPQAEGGSSSFGGGGFSGGGFGGGGGGGGW